MNTPTVPSEAPRPAHESGRRSIVAALQRRLHAADPGTLAALRRLHPDAPPSAFYRVTVDVLDEHLAESGPRRDEIESRWAVILAAMASAQDFLAPVPLGEALARAGVAELRVVRLLEAQGVQLADLVRSTVHQLVQKGQPFDPNDLADLVLSDGGSKAREVRRNISRSFYRHEDT